MDTDLVVIKEDKILIEKESRYEFQEDENRNNNKDGIKENALNLQKKEKV